MDKRILGIPLVLVGVIVIAGSLIFAAPLLFELTVSLDEISSSDPSFFGFDETTISSLRSELSSLIFYAWVWIIAATLAALFCVYYSIQLFRKKV